MGKYILYIGENRKFDLQTSIEIIESIGGISNCKKGDMIGAVFECFYGSEDGAIIRISKLEDVITIDASEGLALEFVIEFQNLYQDTLLFTDDGLNFNINLQNISSLQVLKSQLELRNN